MKVLIIEDEKPAADRLVKLLENIEPGIDVAGILESIEDSVAWFEKNPSPDLVFLDIHLADGDSFQIFKKVNVSAPIIFTTAYDEYALEAFKVNSIDYLLKPIDPEHLARSFRKLKELGVSKNASEQINLKNLADQLARFRSFKTRFLIRQKDRLLTVEDNQVAWFNAINKVVILVTYENKQYVMDENLETYESRIDPSKFFRLNRSYLVHRNAIKNIELNYAGKLKIDLQPPAKEEVFVSREKAQSFKFWLEG